VAVEPFLNVGGGVVLPPGFLRGLRELCDRAGALLILDEVFTAYGRCGQMFACRGEGVEPDILVTSKGLSGGYVPIGAVTVRQDLYSSFGRDPVLGGIRYGHTNSGHGLACAAALATLDVLEREELVTRAGRLGQRLQDRLTPLTSTDAVIDVRGAGLAVVVEMRSGDAAGDLVAQAQRRGLLLRRQGAQGQAVLVAPPLIIDAPGIDAIAGRIEESLDELTVAGLSCVRPSPVFEGSLT
jgi:adenosylmethionine-8-amino-7-oxononanoate aminotransferase